MATLVKMFEGEEGTIPFTRTMGSAPNVMAKESCLVVWPEAIERSGLVITDRELEDLGYVHRIAERQIALNKYFKVGGKKINIGFSTAARWIAIQADKTICLFFKKPRLVNGKWFNKFGYRLYRCSPYVVNHKLSLRKLYPIR